MASIFQQEDRYFFKQSKGKFTWESNIVKIEFSEPIIDNTNITQIKDLKGVRYFYYRVKIYSKYRDYLKPSYKSSDKWHLVRGKYISEFPAIDSLSKMLDYTIGVNTALEGIEQELTNGEKIYTVSYDTGYLCHDIYKISKRVNVCRKITRYSLYVGFPLYFEGLAESLGLNIENLNENDIKELQKCVNSFIEYAIKEHNKECQKEYDLLSKNNKFVISENRLYWLAKYPEYNNKWQIEEILEIGDVLSDEGLDFVEKDETGRIIEISPFCKKDVINITNEHLTVKCRYCSVQPEWEDKILEIPFKNITWLNCKDKSVTLKDNSNINDIVNDFLDYMTKFDKKNFKKKDFQELVNLYNIVLLKRYSLNKQDYDFDCFLEEDEELWYGINTTVFEIIKEIQAKI